MVFAMTAPLCAQIMMIVIMLTQRQWLYAVMIVPGVFATLATLLASLPSLIQRTHSTPDTPAVPGTGHAANVQQSAAHHLMRQDAQLFAAIDATELEDLLRFDRMPWRDVVRHWLAPAQWDAPIGMCSEGTYAINMRRQGPHALVAGTTGSGKSVLLQSWCLALAARNGPDRLNFVFLDFKGGSAFRDLEQLPHCVGSVCDLDLGHAARALRALESELTRRERLTAQHRTANSDDLPDPPARLFVVIDEFHALKDQLPDYINRLVRIASLGRSLGMHLIVCTQNPMGQVSADMKANMALNICLRVRDELQSSELLGDGRAARISPAMPGAAFCNDSEQVTAIRCANVVSISNVCRNIGLAARFMGLAPAEQLFSSPLPAAVRYRPSTPTHDEGVWFGISDDGIRLSDATVSLRQGNVGIIGGHGRGKSTVLEVIYEQMHHIGGYMTRISRSVHGIWRTQTVHQRPLVPIDTSSTPRPPQLVWLVDDADELFDPFRVDEQASQFKQALADPGTTVIFTASSLRHIRIPDHCLTRIVFPSGEKTNDMMAGIPSTLLAQMNHADYETAGRAVLITGAQTRLVQCAS
ncbi:cell division protein FtsK [Bifidobacterium sp. LC6]|uniref:Cell division protein FtsK n=2 Tax=Bifidobacterium colobi TaxID=2809026 RepID=A0ABS5UVW0_9BIFI|nr:FtsK/SpoIIIE domain-containing protein [Bifidobacterium colobi]MBT1174851.1 cell division protein FtsK [Bifidobacterium colobi]